MRESWGLKSIDMGNKGTHKQIAELLEDGWEPFAVSDGSYGAVCYHFRKYNMELPNG